MSKKTGKAKETIILIRIPDAQTRRGEASLTVQRGDLGTMQQFAYTGLTLSGNIAQAVQAALVALAKLEAAPPILSASATHGDTPAVSSPDTADPADDTNDAPDPDLTDNTDNTDTDDSSELEEAEELEVDEDDLPAVTVHVPTSSTPAATATAAALPLQQAQMSLF